MHFPIFAVKIFDMENESTNPETAFGTMMTIWAALVMSQMFFPVIVFFAKPELFRFDLTKSLFGDYAVEIGFLGFISIVNLIVSFTLRKRFTDQAISTGRIALVQTAMIFGCALCELASLFGLLVAFVFDFQYFFVFSALGILGTLLHFPRRSDIHAVSLRSPGN